MTNPFKFWKKKKYRLMPRKGEPRQDKDTPAETVTWAAIVGTAIFTLLKKLK